jgi:UDP-N-acetylglucosamine transferase subunit ALG13
VVSVGTDHHPFERLIDWTLAAKAELDLDVVVQRGSTPERDGLESVDYVSPVELEAMMQSADVVVSHGGPGTIALALRSGHRPVVVPRDPSLGEHVDDHQLRYVSQLDADQIVDVATTLDDFLSLLSADRAPLDTGRLDDEREASVAQFAGLVDRLMAGDLPFRRWRDRIVFRRAP